MWVVARLTEQLAMPMVAIGGLLALTPLRPSASMAADSSYATASLVVTAAASRVTPPAPPSATEIRDRCRDAHPLSDVRSSEQLETAQIVELLKTEPMALGSASIGLPNRGALYNAVQLEQSDGLLAVSPSVAWGTETAVASIERAVAEVRCRFENTPQLQVGSLSRRFGGPLWPHRSHQSGVDADLSFYYLDDSGWYTEATEDNLDALRSWALVDALVAMGNVQYIFLDRRLHDSFRRAAITLGEDEDTVEALFDGTSAREPIVRHARGHDDHLHVRFEDDVSLANARALIPLLGRRYAYLVRGRRRR